jgi:hypothetical protein
VPTADGTDIVLRRIRAQAADQDRLTAREDSGEPSERGVPDARIVRVGVLVTELAVAVHSSPRSACPAPEPGFAVDRWQYRRRFGLTLSTTTNCIDVTLLQKAVRNEMNSTLEITRSGSAP